jgi:hypothetical protein
VFHENRGKPFHVEHLRQRASRCLPHVQDHAKRGAPALVIERVTGVSGTKDEATTYISSEVSHELNTVRYTAQYPAIDFFQSLGSISEML